ncbi:MAG: hypothetical protein CML67_16285 [Rhodobacteraceae bacterium]|nr:hypothetical protein [Paracoccaceae bacterium]
MSDHESQFALLLGNYRPTMVIARELKARGYRVATGLDGFERGAALSRHVDCIWTHPKLEEDETAFARALSEVLARRDDIRLVVPVSEPYVRFFARGKVDLPGGVLAMMVAPELVETCLDKRHMLATAEAAGVPVAPFAEVGDHAALVAEAERIGFPVVIRSLSSSHRLLGEKAVTADDRKALDRLLPDWPEGHFALLLQRRASGPRHNLYFSARNGRVDSLLHVRITRTDRLDGAGLAVEGEAGETDPALGGYTAAMVAALGYSGIGCAQFLVDPETGETCFLEINPRFAGNHAIPAACGLKLTDRLLDVCLSHEPRHDEPPARSQLRYCWLAGDLLGVKVAWRNGQVSTGDALRWLGQAMRARWRAQLDVGYDWRDPLPGLLAILDVLPGIGKLVRRWNIRPGPFAKHSL